MDLTDSYKGQPMKFAEKWSLAFIGVIACLLCGNPLPSFADTYQIVALESDQGFLFYGMDDFGDVILADSHPVSGFVYDLYFNGRPNGTTDEVPEIADDQGTPCTPPLPPGGKVIHGVCNAGTDAFTGVLSPTQFHNDVYLGPDAELLALNGEGLIFMNSIGDVVYDDHYNDTWYEAVDVNTAPVPEPDAITLLVTDLFGVFGIAYVRKIRSPER
jgi:hypothetical protein